MAACGDYQILFARSAQAIGHGSGVAARWKRSFPQFFPRFDVEATENAIGGARDENYSTCGDDGPPQADRTRRDLLRVGAAKTLHRAKWDLPANFSFCHV